MFLFEQSLLALPVNKENQNVNITAEFPVTEGFENCRPPPAQVGVVVPVLPLPVRPLQHPAAEPQRGPAPAVAHAGPRAGGDPHPQETLHQPLGELAHRQIRRRKMNRHKYKKLLKRRKFIRRRVKEGRKRKRQIKFEKDLERIWKKAGLKSAPAGWQTPKIYLRSSKR
uniref:Aurora kinase A interacting protein 1 n=1 Tax=Junco hyemalis TaxID=40217 RepID=A0A8C5J6X1_JUNHY